MRYRARGATTWLEGRTANVSSTGVLFWAERIMEPNTDIELCFEMPVEINGETGAAVVCRGAVVRTVLPASTDAQPGLAARFFDYEFVRGQKGAVAGSSPL